MNNASISKVQWAIFHREAKDLRATPIKSEERVAQEVREYLEEKREPMYSGRLVGNVGENHKAGGPSATPRGRFATGRW